MEKRMLKEGYLTKKHSKVLLISIAFLCTLVLLWFFKFPSERQNPYVLLPVRFTSNHLPYIQAEVENLRCQMLIDLGSDSECTLSTDVLGQIKKDFLRSIHWIDLKGNSHQTNEFLISLIKIESARIKKLKAKEESISWNSESQLLGPPKEKSSDALDGSLGIGLLHCLHPLFDLNYSALYFTRWIISLP